MSDARRRTALQFSDEQYKAQVQTRDDLESLIGDLEILAEEDPGLQSQLERARSALRQANANIRVMDRHRKGGAPSK